MIGELVYDYALGKSGIVVGGPWVSVEPPIVSWDWCVLFEDGELFGADTTDLQEIKNESR